MGDRTTKLREVFTRERKTPDALKGFTPEYLLSERHKRDADAMQRLAARIVPLGILVGVVLFAAGWGLATLFTQR
jgi:hypothetical protein